MDSATTLVGLTEILAARDRIASLAQVTPVEESRAFGAMVGHPVFLKCEHLQRTGSFKIRGAANCIATLSDAERRSGVVCASAGNHAQGVALAASTFGVRATVFMPTDAPLPKVDATRGYGAEVVLVGANFDEALAAAKSHCEQVGSTFVPPFDHPDVIAGQGTVGLEVVEQLPALASLVVPVGGGGLIAGMAVAVKAMRPDVRIIGVEPSGAASTSAALAAGAPSTIAEVSTMADGIAVRRSGALTLGYIQDHVDEMATVSDEAIARAVLLLVERAKQVVEPAGAAGLAALLAHEIRCDGPVVVVLSGGNVDPLLLNRIIQSGLYEEGRYLVLRTQVGDRPGGLAALLTLVAELRANVLAVEHHRLNTRLGVLEVEVQLELETRGPAHIVQVVESMRGRGYPVDAELPPAAA